MSALDQARVEGIEEERLKIAHNLMLLIGVPETNTLSMIWRRKSGN